MKINIGLLFLLIGALAVTHFVDAQDQTGFISLDCGLVPKDHIYTETRTNITYISDTTMISVGEVKKLGPEFRAANQQQLWSLRAFPEGIRNCYDLQNLRKGDQYLIRASFLYGNYDGRNVLPSFDIYIGPNMWSSVEISSVQDFSFLELVHVLTSTRLQVCLVKTGLTLPFISSLELRPLRNDTYIAQSGSLMKFYRWFLSSKRGFIRFEEDIHDRWWDSFLDDDWRQINTSQAINTSAKCEVPELAMKTAAVPRIADEPLLITWTDTDKYSEYYAYLHFSEIEILKANESRKFFISFNEDNSSQPYSPKSFTLESLSTKRPVTSENGTYVLRLQRTNRASHPPLLNAFELYKVIEFPQLETNQNDVDAVKSIAVMYEMNKIDWQGDPCVPQKYLWDGLSCSYNDSDSPRITSLNLSTSQLKGRIAPYIFNLTQLTMLDLSNNNLIGEVPEFLAQMKLLTYINLSRNKLNGSIPQALLEKKNEGSLNLITDCELDTCYHKPRKNSYLVPTVAAVASLAIVIAVAAFIYILRRKRSARISASRPPSAVTINVDVFQPTESPKPSILTKDRRFTYLEVMRITNNLERVIGKGGFGLVYHGFLNDTEQVAVKMLSRSSAQGYKQFMAEVELLLRVHHRNLVSLVGYCDEGGNVALVYEFMPKGDLKTHLSGKSGRDVLSWASRLRIAAEAAQGLDYLHNGSKPSMVHRDVKTANILLDEHFQAKLADFGLSRSFPVEGDTHVSTVVAGTPGYLDPDYYLTNWLTEKSDVYSYGNVLLEIITNQRVIDNARERTHIAEWVKHKVNRGDVKNMVDPMLQGDYDTNSVWKAIELAMSCVNPSPRKRPTMPLVVMELTGCLAAEMARTQGSNNQSEHGFSQ